MVADPSIEQKCPSEPRHAAHVERYSPHMSHMQAAVPFPLREHLLSQLAEMPSFLETAFTGLPQEVLLAQSPNDKSPLLEHLWHLRDCESDLYGHRIDQVLRYDQPQLPPVDVGEWPVERGYLGRPADQAVREFCALRLTLIERIRSLTEKELVRTGVRFDSSLISVYGLIEQIAEHDRDHRTRMTSILKNCLTQAVPWVAKASIERTNTGKPEVAARVER